MTPVPEPNPVPEPVEGQSRPDGSEHGAKTLHSGLDDGDRRRPLQPVQGDGEPTGGTIDIATTRTELADRGE